MKIVFVTYHYWPPHFGGELKISIERFESLIRRGHSVIVLTSGVPGFPIEEEINGIKVKRSPLIHDSRAGRGIRRLLFPLWACWVLRQMQFDILHHGGVGGVEPISNLIGVELLNREARKKGTKSIWVHSLADNQEEPFTVSGFDKKVRNKSLADTDIIVSVSPALHQAVMQYFPNKGRLITNSIRDDLFKPISKEERVLFRRNYGISEEQVVFSFLGTISQRKGFDLLSSAFETLLNQYPSLNLWVIGPKNRSENQNVDESELAKLRSNLENYPNTIKLWGRIDDRHELVSILASSDVFVFPTRMEGMPLAPMEAMSCGIPVIISRIPGVTDIANVEGETGYYVDMNNIGSLRDAMWKLASDYKLRVRMGIAARKRIEAHFGWQKHVDEWESLYASLINTNHKII